MINCPLCNSTKGTDYRHPIKIPIQRPYEIIYEQTYVYRCYGCGEYFTHSTYDPH